MLPVEICLAVILVIAVINDLISRRIPNYLILTGLLLAFGYHGYLEGFEGIAFSAQGFAAGILLLIIPFAMGGLGAGDVKLLGVIGAFMGTAFVVNTFLFMALWGGIIVVILLIKEKRLKNTITKIINGLLTVSFGFLKVADTFDKKELHVYFPYGLAIALGALSSYFQGGWF